MHTLQDNLSCIAALECELCNCCVPYTSSRTRNTAKVSPDIGDAFQLCACCLGLGPPPSGAPYLKCMHASWQLLSHVPA